MSRIKFTPSMEANIINICNTSETMAKACMLLEMNMNTFITHAKRLGCYKPNIGGKGTRKNKPCKEELKDILKGKPSNIQTYKLKLRMLKAGIKQHKCEGCNNTQWLDDPIPLELHHINGKHHDHRLENLQLLCPNCHAKTDTYRAKNKK